MQGKQEQKKGKAAKFSSVWYKKIERREQPIGSVDEKEQEQPKVFRGVKNG